MANNEEEFGFFEGLLLVVGLISGGIFGFNNGGWLGLFVGALAFGAIGKWVGTAADGIVKFLLLVAFLLINGAIRRFIWELISSLFG